MGFHHVAAGQDLQNPGSTIVKKQTLCVAHISLIAGLKIFGACVPIPIVVIQTKMVEEKFKDDEIGRINLGPR
jgi:hypothetical protein